MPGQARPLPPPLPLDAGIAQRFLQEDGLLTARRNGLILGCLGNRFGVVQGRSQRTGMGYVPPGWCPPIAISDLGQTHAVINRLARERLLADVLIKAALEGVAACPGVISTSRPDPGRSPDLAPDGRCAAPISGIWPWLYP